MHLEFHIDLSVALLARTFQCFGSQWCRIGGLVWRGQHWICSTYFFPQAPVCRPRSEHLRRCCLLSTDGTEIKTIFYHTKRQRQLHYSSHTFGIQFFNNSYQMKDMDLFYWLSFYCYPLRWLCLVATLQSLANWKKNFKNSSNFHSNFHI